MKFCQRCHNFVPAGAAHYCPSELLVDPPPCCYCGKQSERTLYVDWMARRNITVCHADAQRFVDAEELKRAKRSEAAKRAAATRRLSKNQTTIG